METIEQARNYNIKKNTAKVSACLLSYPLKALMNFKEKT